MKLEEILTPEAQEEFKKATKKSDRVVILHKAGIQNNVIANILNTTKDSVSSMISRSGVTRGSDMDADSLMALDFDVSAPSSSGIVDARAETEVEINIEPINDMEFPGFETYKTGTVFDRLWSDDDEEGGMFSGTINMVTGESGVGKSTLLIDYLSKIKHHFYKSNEIDIDGEARAVSAKLKKLGLTESDVPNPLYFCTEMTRNDIQFYAKKMPIIGSLDTILAHDYMKGGLQKAVTKVFLETDHPIILLDSFQDLVEKLKDMYDWTAKFAENFLINTMVEAAETKGKSILVIMHMGKSGQYVGRTYLKHATTSMLELRFDKEGNRCALFSKNRRGGSMTHKPLTFLLPKGATEISYDVDAFMAQEQALDSAKTESERRANLQKKFDDLLGIASSNGEDVDEEDDYELGKSLSDPGSGYTEYKDS